ncbi:MAG: hypothetical protein JJU46_02765 [Balneolaceae bacterium]|nr:hypothetical protein [Balneolaceae bacterium]MCH8549360.1 hypothetical protein [Balneolaceae bacterium]
MKNITFTANKSLIEKARLKAKMENTSLNKKFREWLEQYAAKGGENHQFNQVMNKLNYTRSGKSFTRDEMNER